jgi:hypothetical protein
MLGSTGWQMERRGNESNNWKGWYSDECGRGKGKVPKALNK